MANGIAKEKLGKTSTVRTSPGVVFGNRTQNTISPYSEIEYTELVVGSNSADDRWFKLANGSGYVQYIYAGRQYYDILQEPAATEPPTDPPPSGGTSVPYNIKVTVGGVEVVNFNGSTTEPPPADAPVIRQVRKWGDPVLVELLGASVDLIPPDSNFQVVKLGNLQDNGVIDFNDIANYQKVNYDFLKGLQYDQPGQYGGINQIMNWLVNHGGIGKRPYWMNGTTTLYFGPLVFGGQFVEIDPTPYTYPANFPNAPRRNAVFYKVLGMRKSEMEEIRTMGGIEAHKKWPWKIQNGTGASLGNKYSDRPRGTEIFHPVWDSRDWLPYPHKSRLYICAEFLEE